MSSPRNAPLAPSECHSSICVNGVAFFAPVAAACIAVDVAAGIALWRTKDWAYESRTPGGSLVERFKECPDPMAFSAGKRSKVAA